ncbi:MAG: SIS domain-containing protein [Gemmataceae bacterium]|nr:SIS domain-containing protein [Gemmataceae bacterium]MDW8264208.1 SIS domain-containing protein [Gemmataceae bacterium]
MSAKVSFHPASGRSLLAEKALAEWRQLIDDLANCRETIDELARWTAGLILGGSRLLACGNGGSAAEAQHFATELVGRYSAERRSLPAVALSADGSLLTCISNDYGANELFARQVRGQGRPGDLLVALSTSGQSRNVLLAIRAAREVGLHTLALLGKGGGVMAGEAERQWIVPSQSTARIQEAHLLFIHVVCDYVDAALTASG